MVKPASLLILGDGAFAAEALDIAEAAGGVVPLGFVNSVQRPAAGATLAGLPVFWVDDVAFGREDCELVCAIVSTRRRGFIERMVREGFRFRSLVHPFASVSKRASLAEGCIVNAGAVISSNARLGSHCIVNRGALIGHDTVTGQFCTIGPLFSQDGIPAHGLLYINPMSRMLEFIAGMCCCILWRSLRRDIDGAVMAFTLAEILAVALAATLLIRPFPFAHAGVGPAGTLWMVRTSAMPGFCAIVAVFAFGRGLLSRLPGSRPFEFPGEISFASYLVQLLTIRGWARLVVPVAQWGFGDFAAVAISTLLAAAALHLMIERPCRWFVVRLGRLDPAGPCTPGARRQ